MPSEFLSMPVTLNCYGNPILQDKKKKVVAIILKVLLFYKFETNGLFVATLYIHSSILSLDLSVAFDSADHFPFLENLSGCSVSDLVFLAPTLKRQCSPRSSLPCFI